MSRCSARGTGLVESQSGKKVIALPIAAIMVLAMLLLMPGAALSQPQNWTRVDPGGGFGDAGNTAVESMQVYNDTLYAGTGGNPVQVWAYDGQNWRKVNEDGFGDANNSSARSMAVFGGKLYVGTENNATGGEVWAYDAGADSWAQVNTDGFGDANNTAVESLRPFDDTIFAGTRNNNGGMAYAWDTGTTWNAASTPGLGDANNVAVTGMTVLGDALLAGTDNPANGAEVRAYAGGTTWNVVGAAVNGFGDGNNVVITSMLALGGNLFAGTENQVTGTEVWAYNGTAWAQANADGFGSANNTRALSMAAFKGLPAVGTYNDVDGAQVWSFNGTEWVKTGDFHGTDNNAVTSLELYQRRLYAGTYNTVGGGEVWATQEKQLGSTSWFLAEGSTAGGFDTWILVQNPQAVEVAGDVTFRTTGSITTPFPITLPAHSRLTIRVADHVPNEYSVSTQVNTSAPVVAERSMYWNSHLVGETATAGSPQPYEMRGGHANLGVPLESVEGRVGTRQYFAEGATAEGFDTWILLCNVHNVNATAHLRYMTESGVAAQEDVAVPANTRQTVNVDKAVPNSFNVGTEVTSDSVLVAERATYWSSLAGAPAAESNDGSSTGGSEVSETEWFLPEGSTGVGFDTYIMLLNPQSQPAQVQVTFMDKNGVVDQTTKTVDAESRETVTMSKYAPNNWEVATSVVSDVPVVAERTMYWDKRAAPNAWSMRAGHSTTGSIRQSSEWLVPEGSTGIGFDSWVLVSNTGTEERDVHVTFMNPGGVVAEDDLKVGAKSRLTIHVIDYVPNDFSVSTLVQASGDVIVERAMYWDRREWPGIQAYEMMGGHAASSLDP